MSTYSTNLALELIGTGEQAGVWGTTTNTNLGTLIEQAISGYVTQAVATGTDTTITIPNGATGVARNMYIELTGTGGTNTNLIVPANKKLYFIFNNSTGAVTVKVSGQTGVSVPQGKKVVLTSNGTDIVNGLNYIADFGSNSATITQLTATSATITNLTLTSLVISNLSIASANITTLTATNETISGNLTLSGGTANGVLYLNGSKVATSGSALVFDGTNLGVGAASGTSSGYATAPQLLNYSASATNLLNASDTTSTIRSALYRDTTGAGIISMAKFRGTYASPTAVQSGDTSGRLWFEVWGGSNLRRIAEVGALVDTYTSDTNISGTLYFATSTSGNASSNEKMRLTAAGNLGIGTTSWPSGQRLRVSGGDVGFEGQYLYLTNADANIQMGAAQNAQIINSDSGNLLTISRTGASSAMAFSTAGSEAMRITNAQNVGIGTASPAARLQVKSSAAQAVNIEGTTARGGGNIFAAFLDPTGRKGYVGYASASDDGFYLYNEMNSFMVFATNNTERARITAGGVLCVNSSSNVGAEVTLFKQTAGAGSPVTRTWNDSTSGNNEFIEFATESSYTSRGSITYNRGAGQVAYNITSDARLKENIADAEEAGSKIDAMQVRQFDWKETGNHLDYGFVAQELHDVAPHAVSKPEDDDAMWSVDYSKLVPMLIKEVQSLRKRVAELESK